MTKEEFIILIKSIGFKHIDIGVYSYKKFKIDSYYDHYYFYNTYGWDLYKNNNLKPIQNNFKKELRAIKLKQLLR